MPTPTSPDSGADLTNQFISDKYTSLLHLSAAQLTSPLAEDQTSHGVYDGKGNYTGMGVTTTNISFNNITMPKSEEDTTLVDYLFPINSIFMSFDDVNPGVRMTGTVWALVSKGLFLAGVGELEDGDRNGDKVDITAGANNGEYNHTLTVEEMPSHKHGFSGANGNADSQSPSPFMLINDDAEKRVLPGDPGNQEWQDGNNMTDGGQAEGGETGIFAAGGGQAHNNIPPSYGVYVWRRTS